MSPHADGDPTGPSESARHAPQETVLSAVPRVAERRGVRWSGTDHDQASASIDDSPVSRAVRTALEAEVDARGSDPQASERQLRQPRGKARTNDRERPQGRKWV